MTRSQSLMFQLAQAHLRAELGDMDFPKEVRDQTAPLLAEANRKMREAKALFGRVSEIHKANEDKRLDRPEGSA